MYVEVLKVAVVGGTPGGPVQQDVGQAKQLLGQAAAAAAAAEAVAEAAH
jgi:hypothetical protein